METIENRKRIEYRPILKVVRTPETLSVLPQKEVPDIRTVQDRVTDSRKTQIPVDYRGYIKCKTHDFF